MLGLFERDYTQIYESERKYKEELDIKYNSTPRKYGRRTPFREYPKAIRHNMSLFPNNYMDINLLKEEETLKNQCDEFESLLNQNSIKELDIKHFIQENKYYHIPASIFGFYNFGHHEASLFKEFQLGTYYKVDYLLVGRASGGYQFIFVEFENPYTNIIKGNGNLGETVRKGIEQINDWKTYVEQYYTSLNAEFLKYTNKTLPNEFINYDATRMNYVVVAGRRLDFEADNTRVIQRRIEKEQNIKILHYDNLLDEARRLIGAQTY